jgi:hypothetical protein
MDDRTKKILIAAGVGIVLAYFVSRPSPAAAAETVGDKKSLGDGGGRSLTDGGGGSGGDKYPKSTLYGDATVESYQRRIGHTVQTVKDYLAANPGAFEATGLITPGVDGDWGDETQRASDAFIKLLYQATRVINADPKATAAYRKRDGAFRYIQELVRDLQGAGERDVILPQIQLMGTPAQIEAAVVKAAGRYGDRTRSASDFWAQQQAGIVLAGKAGETIPRITYPFV